MLAHAPTTAPSLRLPFDTSDLTLSSAGNGDFEFTNSSGATVYSMLAPVMYGSYVDPATGLNQSKVVSATLTQTTDGARLNLAPSMAWLADPATVYPVTIDPTVNATVAGGGDTWVQDNITTSEISDYRLRVGEYGGVHMSRSYLWWKGLTAVTGKHILSASVKLWNWDVNSCTAATMHASRLTSQFTSGTTWTAAVPTVDTGATYAGSGSFAHGVDGTCNNDYGSIDVTKMVAGWAAGSIANDGMQLSSTGSQYWGFCSLNYDTAPSTSSCSTIDHQPHLSITYNTLPGTPAGLSVAPCTSTCTGTVLTNTTTPTLTAKASDADGGNLTYEFQVWAGTSASPTTEVTYGSTTSYGQGATASWKVPAGKLANGSSYEYRSYAKDGTDTGSWSAWQKLTVDTTAPTAPTVSSTTWTAGQWGTPTSGTISWSDGASDLASYSYQLDGGAWSTPSTATSHAFSNLASYALHTVTVKATDKAGNVSPISTFKFGIGTGGVSAPSDGDATQARVTLTAQGPAATPYVTYQWRDGATDSWKSIPSGDVTLPGTNTQPTTWPVVSTDTRVNGTASYVWDLAETISAAGDGDGLIDVQACLSTSSNGSSPVCQAQPVQVQLSAHSFDAANATSEVGPGTLSLLTGDYAVSATDANIAAYNSTLGVSRTATSLAPAAASSDATGVFGPGWTASLQGPSGGDADLTPSVTASDKSRLAFTGADGGQQAYTASGNLTSDTITYAGVGDTGTTDDGTTVSYAWRNPVNPALPHITMTRNDGTATTWVQPNGSGTWVPYSVVATGTASATTTSYYYTSAGLPERIVAPNPDLGSGNGTDCSTEAKAASTEGCRPLTFSYTTVTGGATRLAAINVVAWDPTSSSMVPTAIARYDYDDNTGRLAHAWDPRISPALKTAYHYNGDGRLDTITPPGLAAWTLQYDSGGRLSTISRPDTSGATATTTTVYGLPLSGAGLPDVTGTTAATWAETSDLPTTGTAIFAPDHKPTGTVAETDWAYASISYLDANGRDVNDAGYGAGDWQIDTTQYDASGNDVWDLTAGNRAQALTPTGDTDPYAAALTNSADRANLFASTSTYNAGTAALPAGSELIDQQGPLHPVTLANGTVVDARDHTVTGYDAGAPNNDDHVVTNPDGSTTDLGPYMLPTSTTTSVLDTAGADHDPQTSTAGYSAAVSGDADGWALGQPTSETDPGGLVTTTSYNPSGQVTALRPPAKSGSSGDRTTDTSYYTATGTGPCVNAAFAGLICSTTPHTQPTQGNPLPVTTYSYDMYGNMITKTETYGTGGGAVTRTTTTTGYDAAERTTSSSTAVSPASAGGTAVPTVHYSYDPSTGLRTVTSTGTGASEVDLTTGYDNLGQATTYQDATGNKATTSYDIDGRVTSVNDGKGTTSYTYDTATEHRGLVTSEDIGIAGAPSTFAASYDAAGNLTTETYPNGLVATSSYNNNGGQTALNYAKAGVVWMSFSQDINAHGQIAEQSSPQSAQSFIYDGSDRLTTVQDTINNPGDDATECTTRVYSFDNDSNRTSLKSYPDAGTDPANGACSTSTNVTTISSSYDDADRITNTGYSYDTLGRTLTVPAADAQGIGGHVGDTGTLTLGYYANDMVVSQAQGSANVGFALDPLQNRISTQSDGTITTTNHYAGDSDNPAWTSTSPANWTRNVTGPDGGLAASIRQDGATTLQLTNLHGDIIAAAADDTTATSITSYSEFTEYGVPRTASSAYASYGWLGARQRLSGELGGLVLMGVRLYDPQTGRFQSVDPIDGGNANAYIYPSNPVSVYDLSGEDAEVCSGDVCLQVWSRGGHGTFIEHVRVFLRNGFLTNSNSVVEYYQRYETSRSYTNVLRGAAFPPWKSYKRYGTTWNPYSYNWYPNRTFKNLSYICGAITGHFGFPCAHIHT
jgi:RHS repeat-associated protein